MRNLRLIRKLSWQQVTPKNLECIRTECRSNNELKRFNNALCSVMGTGHLHALILPIQEHATGRHNHEELWMGAFKNSSLTHIAEYDRSLTSALLKRLNIL